MCACMCTDAVQMYQSQGAIMAHIVRSIDIGAKDLGPAIARHALGMLQHLASMHFTQVHTCPHTHTFSTD
jgi:hypothetical protein